MSIRPLFLYCLMAIVYCLLLLFSSCKPNLDVPLPLARNADYSRFVAIGGDYMAGYQDDALYQQGQKYSLPALLAKQFELVAGGTFRQPLMPDNSGLGVNMKPWESEFNTASKLGYKTDCQGVSSLYPLKNNFSFATAGIYLQHLPASFQNISVPFAKISEYDDPSLGNAANANPYYKRFAPAPGTSTMLSDALDQQPTFFALWAGMEDIYDYASNGGNNKSILSASAFSNYLDSILSNLHTKGAIANIPDINSFPFYTLVPWNGLTLTKNQADTLNLTTGNIFNFHEGSNGFVIGDTNVAFEFRKMLSCEYVLLSVPTDSLKCNGMGSTDKIPDRYVLDSNEVIVVKNAIANYNSVISVMAQKYNLAFVDMNAFFKSVTTGIKWDGADYNATFVSGGFFSLDGYHPHQKGYAIIANEFIKAMNQKYNSTIPWVNCPECNGVLFP